MTTKNTDDKKKNIPIYAKIDPDLHERLKKLAERYATKRLMGGDPKLSYAIRAALVHGVGPAEIEQDAWEASQKSARKKTHPKKKAPRHE